jgi:sarcosine oxidase, subunit delta
MQIDCPYCGRRDETEFTYGGEAHIARPAISAPSSEWTEYLYFRDNLKGEHAERWRHSRGCGQWFHAIRNTATHEFVAYYRLGDAHPITAAPKIARA